MLPATIVRCGPDPGVNRCGGNIKVEFQTKLTLSRENQNGIPRSKFDPISSLTCSSFCNLTCLTGSGGKVMGVVRLSSHQATLRQVKPNMGIQIMSSNNLWWQDCISFSLAMSALHCGTVVTTSTRMSNATLGRLA